VRDGGGEVAEEWRMWQTRLSGPGSDRAQGRLVNSVEQVGLHPCNMLEYARGTGEHVGSNRGDFKEWAQRAENPQGVFFTEQEKKKKGNEIGRTHQPDRQIKVMRGAKSFGPNVRERCPKRGEKNEKIGCGSLKNFTKTHSGQEKASNCAWWTTRMGTNRNGGKIRHGVGGGGGGNWGAKAVDRGGNHTGKSLKTKNGTSVLKRKS